MTKTETREEKIEFAAQRALTFLADLNGCDWIKGDDAGSIDMRGRAKHLHRLLYVTLRSSVSA